VLTPPPLFLRNSGTNVVTDEEIGRIAMARLKPLAVAEAPEAARPILQRAEAATGRISEGIGIQARCPEVLIASRALSAMPAKSGTLPAEIRALVCLRAAQMITCPF